MQTALEPHPLDSDWRFDKETLEELLNILPRSGRILALGCPSLAKRLQGIGREVSLVDRQPIHGVKDQIELDIQIEPPFLSGFPTAIIDPPWYPEHVRRWIGWAANCVIDGGEILASIWPPKTRPSGEREFAELLEWVEKWARVTELDYRPKYMVPPFEIASQSSSRSGPLSSSPRIGRLVRIEVREKPPLPPALLGNQIWTRFVLNNYQIGIRMRSDRLATPSIVRIANADGWIWPYVSRRAPEREQIDIWSSRNEVGRVTQADFLVDALRKVSESQNSNQFEKALLPFPSLMEWEIPRPPYWRTQEWSHRQ